MENLQIVKTENGKTAVQCSELYRALGLRNNNYTRWYKSINANLQLIQP